VQLPPDTDLESVRLKLAYDLYYVQHLGLVFDVLIYLATFGKVLGLSASALRILGRFPQRDMVEREYTKLS
jgi:lipopolysaccharide/colanic/teichoic acid biosynthesis glycosyltransferase